METIGKNIIKLDYQKGYSTQFASGISVCIGSILGVPLSTTHCVLGALAGVYFAGKTPIMLKLYPNAQENTDSANNVDVNDIQVENGDKAEDVKPLNEGSRVNLATIKKIVAWCLITVPCSLTFSLLTSKILTTIFDGK